MASLKAHVHRLLESDPHEPGARWIDRFLVVLILLNVLAVILETVGDNATRYHGVLVAFEWLSLAAFGLEYLLRLWSATEDPRYASPVLGRLRWMATPWALVDLVAILPGLAGLVGVRAGDLRFVRVLRLLRLLKLGRYTESFRVLARVLQSKKEELLMALFIVLVALVLSSSFMYYAEREAQPEAFSSIPAAMWWSIITLTTIGYGDVVPVTDAGRLVGGASALMGIFALALPVGILASGFTTELENRRKRPPTCAHCGKDPTAK